MLPREVRTFWQDHQLQGAVDIPEFRYTPAVRRPPRPRRPARRRSASAPACSTSAWSSGPEELEPPSRHHAARRPAPADRRRRRHRRVPVRPRRRPLRRRPRHPAGQHLLGHRHPGRVLARRPGPPAAGDPARPPAGPAGHAAVPGVAAPGRPRRVRPAQAVRHRPALGRDRPPAPAGDPRVAGRLAVVDGAFDCVWFPYPFRHATGTVPSAPTPPAGSPGSTWTDVRGQGVAGGPNADRVFRVDGWVGPLTPEIGCGIHATGQDVSGEPPLFAAFPPAVRQALGVFQSTDRRPAARLPRRLHLRRGHARRARHERRRHRRPAPDRRRPAGWRRSPTRSTTWPATCTSATGTSTCKT